MEGRPPISDGRSGIRKVLLRALNKNQIILLNSIARNSTKTITSISNSLSSELNIPVSTLKLNCRILKQLDLIAFETTKPVSLTQTGKIVLNIMGEAV
ncbi:MAG: hypothetical protein HY516_05150 [Candidatus Aenigmarchaeota archaeon]|nr:hypothetical protein [Candidatus Aenigmarchaeota archaeon]